MNPADVPRGDDLSCATFSLYLEDKTFVEYFNSFLVLPIFSNKIVYNEDTRHFEQILLDGGTREGERKAYSLSSITSTSTIHLTDECIGPTMDKGQCWQWVLEHRLPLFMKSDLFSEFKLCKVLTAVRYTANKGVWSGVIEGERVIGRRRSQSAVDPLPPVPGLSPNVLSSKRGMGLFWRFLQGTAGEKNWLFWLDSERIKYCSSQQEKMSMVRVLRERYLTPAAPLELPVESKIRVGLARKSAGDMAEVAALQLTLAENLRNYWLSRFVMHHRRANLRAHYRPHTSQGISHYLHQSRLSFSIHYPRVLTPLLPLESHTFYCVRGRGEPNSGYPYSHVGTILNSSSEESVSVGGEECLQLGFYTRNGQGRIKGKKKSKESDVGGQRIFARDPSRCSSLPHLVESETRVGNSMFQLERPDPQSASCLPQSLRQAYTQSPIPSPLQGTSVAHDCPPTGSSGYHKLTTYTARHLPSPAQNMPVSSNHTQLPPTCHTLSVSGTPILPPSQPPQSPITHMVHCLASEYRSAGGYFEKHLKSLPNAVPLDCLIFWREVQEYKCLFLCPSFHPPAVETKARALYGRFVVESCPTPLSLPPAISSHLAHLLHPPYDDLFDEAEEHILRILLEQWEVMNMEEEMTFQKMDRVDLSRLSTSKRRAPSAAPCSPLDENTKESEDSVSNVLIPLVCHQTPQDTSNPSLFSSPHPHQISSHSSPSPLPTLTPSQPPTSPPSSSTAVGLSDIVDDPSELEHFKTFLNERKAAQHLMCWMEIEAFRGIPSRDNHLRDLRACQLRERYFNRRYLLGPHSPAGREAQRQIVAAGGGNRLPARPRTAVFREAQKHVQAKLEKKWLAEFLETPEYKARSGVATEREREDAGEDGHSAKKRVTANADLRFAQSHEALLLRKVLQNESSREIFLSFLTVSETSDSNCRADVEFWLEVQRFKKMCHAHTDRLLLSDKLKAMKECYLNSSVPPKLHINIPQHMADAILHREVGPYVFREAQTVVFRHLYSYWQDYQIMSHDLTSPTEISDGIAKMKLRMEQLRKAREEQERAMRDSEKMFQFETAAERKERMKREREEKAFGEVGVNFTLVNPQQQYTYHTTIPHD